jgi:hypothetical protein
MAAMSETFDLEHGDPRGRLVDELRRQVGGWGASAPQDEVTLSWGTAELDRLLAGSPLRYGMLIEWLSGVAAATGAATLSLLSAREACRAGGALVVIDRQQTFYPPAAAAWGIDLSRLLIVRPRGARDELWAAVQALRSPAVAAVWAMINRLDSREFRRLQLAAQAGRTLGLLLRPAHVRGQPSWADVRLQVGPSSVVRCPLQSNHGPRTTDHGRYVQIRVLRSRAGRPGGSVILEIDDAAHTVRETKGGYQPSLLVDNRPPKAESRKPKHDAHPLPLVPELANPTAPSLSARA